MKDLRPGDPPTLQPDTVRESRPRTAGVVERARRRGAVTYDELIALPAGRLEQAILRLDALDLPVAPEPEPRPLQGRPERPPVDQPLSLYLSDVSDTPVPSPAEEYRLARIVEIAWKRARLRIFATAEGLRAAARHLGDPPGSRAHTADQRRRLALRLEALDLPTETIYPLARALADPAVDLRLAEYERALGWMVRVNLRLAVSVARRFRGRGAPLLDMIQDAGAGLLRAAALFRPRRGWRFSTYAVWWVRQSILQGLGDYNSGFRVPPHVLSSGMKLRAASRNLFQKLGREPEDEELARAAGLPLVTARRALRTIHRPSSLDRAPIDAGERTFGDLLPAPEGDALGTRHDLHLLRLRLDEALSRLPEKERQVLRLRYGLAAEGVLPRPDVARRFGITPERVRQIEVHAARKLRNGKRYGNLAGFLGS